MDIQRIINYLKQKNCINLDPTIILEILNGFETKSKPEQIIIDKCFKGFTGNSIKTINTLAIEFNGKDIKKDKYIEDLNNLIDKLSNEIDLLKIVNKDLKDNYWQLKEKINKTTMKN